MATTSPQLSRTRTIHWDDPGALAEAGQTMSGRDFLDAILRGELPHPPVCQLVDLTFNRIDDGQVEMLLKPDEAQYNPIGSMHGGIIATALDSVVGCGAHTTLEIKVNYLRGVTREIGPMRAIGRVMHFGRRTAMAEGSLSDVSGKLFGQASTTCPVKSVPRAEVDHAYEIDDE
jgi:uncharacterized protein (TIGR00369 family)